MVKSKLFHWSIVASLAGFIFGFDTVVISGANLPIKNLWHTTPLFHGFFIMSMALWGTLFGALIGGMPTEKYGRKKVLIFVGILFAISSLGSAFAFNPYSFSFFRFIGGVGIGISSVVAPTYISEISTPTTRGKLGALYQFNIVFGILIAFLSNYFFQGVGGINDWRWMLGILFIPSLVYTIMVFNIPESPRWLILHSKNILLASTIMEVMKVENIDKEITNILNNRDNTKPTIFQIINDKKFRIIIGLAFFIAFFNQMSGINFILYYAPEILSRVGLAEKDSLLNSILIGGVNLLFTFIGLYFIDRIGRRKLMILGSIGYIISLVMISGCFLSHSNYSILIFFILTFIASHAIGQGAVIWVFISEIFPNQFRAIGQSFGASIHWVFAAIITLFTPYFLDEKFGIFKDNPWPIFAFFAFMMLIQFIWVLFKMPETKNTSLEDLEKKLLVK